MNSTDIIGAIITSILIIVYEIICQYFEWKKFIEFVDFKNNDGTNRNDILFYWSCKQFVELFISICGIICVYLFACLSLNWIVWSVIIFFLVLGISVYFVSYLHIKLKQ